VKKSKPPRASLPITFEPRADLELVEAQLWWLEKRDKAPNALDEDLEESARQDLRMAQKRAHRRALRAQTNPPHQARPHWPLPPLRPNADDSALFIVSVVTRTYDSRVKSQRDLGIVARSAAPASVRTADAIGGHRLS
jgi:hypothetical protein